MGRRTWLIAIVPLLVSSAFSAVPAQADPASDLIQSAIVSYDVHVEATHLVTGATVTHDFVSPVTGGPYHIGELIPAELGELGLVEGPRCKPGGWDLWAWIDAKNILNETVLRFHTDTEFWYDCKKVTSIPFVTVYGSDYAYFWQYDRTIAREKHGVGTKAATVVGAASFKQCLNVGFGEICPNHDSFKITIHAFGNGTFTMEGH